LQKSSYKVYQQKLHVELGGIMLWKPTSFGINQEAYITITKIDTSSPSQGLLLKAQPGPCPESGVIAVVYDAVAKSVRISTFRLGEPNWTIYANRSATFSSGDRLLARVYATGELKIYKNGSLLTTITLTNADKQFFNTKGGKISVWGIAAPNAVYDDFGGGNFVP
jgi:hypothetical protein